MSVMGIAASSIFSFLSSASAQAKYQNFQKEFQQLGQDLSSGNLSAAQLGQALQSGNTTAAQGAYSSLQQDFAALGGTANATSPVSVSA